MYSTCLHCHGSLGKNESIEHFQIGRRLAFDSEKGRLWVVCGHCGRWNLTPIEERWEAVEDCERLFRDEPLRAQTDNIGLTKADDGTELIRIGKPLRPEFAAWRYGGVFTRRLRQRAALGTGAGLLTASAFAAPLVPAIGIAGIVGGAALCLAGFERRRAAPPRGALSGATYIAGETGKPLAVTRGNFELTTIDLDAAGAVRLRVRHSYGREVLVRDRAARALATLLVPANRGGARAASVLDAAEFIAESGGPERAARVVAQESIRLNAGYEERAAALSRGARGRTMEEFLKAQWELTGRPQFGLPAWRFVNRGALHRLPTLYRIALEMSVHEHSEQRALDEEFATLERDWREAEEIAAIADRLLTPFPTKL
jgi:hypothetical protein